MTTTSFTPAQIAAEGIKPNEYADIVKRLVDIPTKLN